MALWLEDPEDTQEECSCSALKWRMGFGQCLRCFPITTDSGAKLRNYMRFFDASPYVRFSKP